MKKNYILIKDKKSKKNFHMTYDKIMDVLNAAEQ